ncbi:hypothetical protein ONS95_002587 [Cadophora gregata]|uniref:uncharacterized protein n=1 Tax=Cadophora gregata TaxID=51156 RepID=UPI0026DC8DF8|nr:uncharacterized protein ONS95_002587 [Cadophora gregata]KAK0109916.1 hypothetical protein ONS95_002587 [Cadophora gregata]KAK0110455.1 hypothetical protein ONS96_002066 [Cadophora gregata f. sp. sojae]
MFDVSWTDPARETVGQRKSRKEQEATNGTSRNTPGLSRGSSFRSSNSSSSTFAHGKPSLLNFFGSSRKGAPSRAGYRTPTPAPLVEEPLDNSQRHSNFTVDSDSSGHEVPGTTTRIPKNGFFGRSPPYYSEGELSAASEASESVFSGWTGKSVVTEATSDSGPESTTSSGKVVQPLSEDSFVTQSTERTVSSPKSVKTAEQTATIVHISSSGKGPVLVKGLSDKVSPPSSAFSFPLPVTAPPKTPPKDNVRIQQVNKRAGFAVAKHFQPSYTWKPPETWEYDEETSKPGQRRSPTQLRPIRERRHKTPPSEIAHLQRSIRRMEAASSKIVLERLREEWVEVADASVYRELEIEKQLWMLTALRTLKNKSSADDIVVSASSRPTKVLSLYENHASCSSLSALTTATSVHHLSTNPLSPKSYPNIHPLLVPGPTSQLPYASNIFSEIHAFSIPSLLPASSIPSIVKECHRTLISATHVLPQSDTSPQSFSKSASSTLAGTNPVARGGTLHLTILDPSPLPATLGPRLREWLDNYLILHLEKHFRCLNPSRLFPVWLSDAGLRSEGSTIVNVRFFAAVNVPKPGLACANGGITTDGMEEVDNTKQELKSIVGRMLWKEMWGSYVQGDKWWWEDESILEECDRMGTVWEYAVIEAVKEG